MGSQISPRQWRHIAIALDRRILQGIGCQIHCVPVSWGQHVTKNHGDVDADSDSDHEPGNQSGSLPAAFQGDQIRHFQAAHGPAVGSLTYGNDVSLGEGMTDVLLTAFQSVSASWHRLAGMDDQPQSSRKRRRRRSSSSSPGADFSTAPGGLQAVRSSPSLRRHAWNWAAIEHALQQLFGPHGAPRDQVQRDGLRMIARSRPETMIVTPTGSGKTIFYIVPTLLPRAEVTVVILLLVVLRQDLIRCCQQWRIAYRCWLDQIPAIG